MQHDKELYQKGGNEALKLQVFVLIGPNLRFLAMYMYITHVQLIYKLHITRDFRTFNAKSLKICYLRPKLKDTTYAQTIDRLMRL